MTFWQNDFLTKWLFDKMNFWQNDFDKMTDKMTFWQNGKYIIMLQVDKMLSHLYRLDILWKLLKMQLFGCNSGSVSKYLGPYSQHFIFFVAYKWADKPECYITQCLKVLLLIGPFVSYKLNEVLWIRLLLHLKNLNNNSWKSTRGGGTSHPVLVRL
jgi:hypothetical protein